MIGRTAHNRIDIFLLKTFAPINVVLSIRKLARAVFEMLLVHITKGDHILGRQPAKVGLSPAPCADESDVKFVAGRLGSKNFGARQNQACGSGESYGFEELASFHIIRF